MPFIRVIIKGYSYKRKGHVIKVKSHIQNYNIKDKTKYRYNKKTRTYTKKIKRKLLYCLYFYALKNESEVYFKNGIYAIAKSLKSKKLKHYIENEGFMFITDHNVMDWHVMVLKRYYTPAPYVKIWQTTRYTLYSDDYEESYILFNEEMQQYRKQYKMRDFKLRKAIIENLDVERMMKIKREYDLK